MRLKPTVAHIDFAVLGRAQSLVDDLTPAYV